MKPYLKNAEDYTDDELLNLPEHKRILVLYELAQKRKLPEPDKMTEQNELYRMDRSYRLLMDGFLPSSQNYCNWRFWLAYNERKRNMDMNKTWKYIRDFHEEKAGFKCMCCGMSGKDLGFKTHTECHEKWRFDSLTVKEISNRFIKEKRPSFFGEDLVSEYPLARGFDVQIMGDMQSLCTVCHAVKHLNRLEVSDKPLFDIAVEFYCAINEIATEQALKDFEFMKWRRKKDDNKKYHLWLGDWNIKQYSKEIQDTLIEFQYYLPFDCHSDEFEKFKKQCVAKEIKDNG